MILLVLLTTSPRLNYTQYLISRKAIAPIRVIIIIYVKSFNVQNRAFETRVTANAKLLVVFDKTMLFCNVLAPYRCVNQASKFDKTCILASMRLKHYRGQR